jgi:hypothetical protein
MHLRYQLQYTVEQNASTDTITTTGDKIRRMYPYYLQLMLNIKFRL